jgi:hypothetical protein
MTTIQAILGLDRGSLVFHPEGLSASFTESDVREAYEALPDKGVVKMVFTTQAGTSNNPFLWGVIRIRPVIWVVIWVSFQGHL